MEESVESTSFNIVSVPASVIFTAETIIVFNFSLKIQSPKKQLIFLKVHSIMN